MEECGIIMRRNDLNNQKKLKKVLTKNAVCDILNRHLRNAGVAQLVEQLICNQQVGGSSPSTSSINAKLNMGEFPSGQRGQTVNLLRHASVVRIHLLPPNSSLGRKLLRLLVFI